MTITAIPRLREIEQRVAWCEAWLARQHVSNPCITREWRNLLKDTRFLVDQSPVAADHVRDTLADILDVCSGWTRSMDDRERLEAIAKLASAAFRDLQPATAIAIATQKGSPEDGS